jgi:hypothetical protein
MTECEPSNHAAQNQLRRQVRALRNIQWAVTGIFLVIITAWLATGSWDANLPAFIGTVAMAVAITAMFSAIRSGPARRLEQLQKQQSNDA